MIRSKKPIKARPLSLDDSPEREVPNASSVPFNYNNQRRRGGNRNDNNRGGGTGKTQLEEHSTLSTLKINKFKIEQFAVLIKNFNHQEVDRTDRTDRIHQKTQTLRTRANLRSHTMVWVMTNRSSPMLIQ